METIKVVITDPVGLHARPASLVVQEANKFNSEIFIEFNGNKANLKSIMSVMAMGVKTGEEIEIQADGEDAAEAISSIKSAMEQNNLI